MLGVVNLDKPVGPTSHDMVGLVRRLTGTRRIARAGRPMELASRTVTVHAIELLGTEPGHDWLDVRLSIRCGPGTYIRAIARDLGERLGAGGHLHALRRTEAAGLDAADAIPPLRL